MFLFPGCRFLAELFPLSSWEHRFLQATFPCRLFLVLVVAVLDVLAVAVVELDL